MVIVGVEFWVKVLGDRFDFMIFDTVFVFFRGLVF